MTLHAFTRAPGTSSSRRRAAPTLPPRAPFASRLPRRMRAHRLRSVALGLLLLGGLDCSRGARAVRLPSQDADAFIYQIDCHTNVTACRKKAAELCPVGYDLLESRGAPVEPARVDTEPGPRSTGSPYQRPDWVGQIVVACNTTKEAAPGVHSEPLTDAAPAPVRAARTPGPDQLCVPGATQLCLGPGACRGAQPCLADGRGYAPCDCGTGSTSSATRARTTQTSSAFDAGVSHP